MIMCGIQTVTIRITTYMQLIRIVIFDASKVKIKLYLGPFRGSMGYCYLNLTSQCFVLEQDKLPIVLEVMGAP